MYLTHTVSTKAAIQPLPSPVPHRRILRPLSTSLQKNKFEMAIQRALLVQEIGKPLVLVHDHPIREPGHGQIQIKVTVAGKSDEPTDASAWRYGQ
jgi:hypothetical protein